MEAVRGKYGLVSGYRASNFSKALKRGIHGPIDILGTATNIILQ